MSEKEVHTHHASMYVPVVQKEVPSEELRKASGKKHFDSPKKHPEKGQSSEVKDY